MACRGGIHTRWGRGRRAEAARFPTPVLEPTAQPRGAVVGAVDTPLACIHVWREQQSMCDLPLLFFARAAADIFGGKLCRPEAAGRVSRQRPTTATTTQAPMPLIVFSFFRHWCRTSRAVSFLCRFAIAPGTGNKHGLLVKSGRRVS